MLYLFISHLFPYKLCLQYTVAERKKTITFDSSFLLCVDDIHFLYRYTNADKVTWHLEINRSNLSIYTLMGNIDFDINY